MMEATKDSVYDDLLRCRPYIEAALAYGGDTHDYVHIVQGILNGSFHFWPMPNSAMVTEFLVYPKKKMLHIFLAGGDLTEIKDMYADVRAFGEANGCDGLSLTGRKGWIKALSDLGFENSGLSYVTAEWRD